MERPKVKGKRQKADRRPKAAKVAEVTETARPREAYAVGRYLKISPTKVRGVLDLIRGETVAEAERILRFSPKKGARIALKVLNSTVANARAKGQFDEEGWFVADARADKGPIFRRKLDYKARGARGIITTPSTHLKIVISAKGGSASGGRQESVGPKAHQPLAEAKSQEKTNEQMENEKVSKSMTTTAAAGSRSGGKRSSRGS